MRVELGAPVVLVQRVDALWHVATSAKRGRVLADRGSIAEWPTICGLDGVLYAFGGPIRERRLCAVCRERAPAEIPIPELGPLPRRQRRRKPFSGRLQPAHLRVLYRLYTEDRLGTYRLAELVWEQLGYANVRSCANAIWLGFTRMGFELRTQSEATAIWNYKHGRKTRAIAGTPAEREYRRWLKQELGRYQPICRGVRLNAPGKGKPCTRPATNGSDYCFAHDPAAAEQRDRIVAAMRSRLTTDEILMELPEAA